MATADPISDFPAPSGRPGEGLLVLLTSMLPEQLEIVLANLTKSLPAEGLIIAATDALPADSYPSLRIVTAPETDPSWALTAADFVNAYQLATQNGARAILMLGPEAGSLGSSALVDLARAVLSTPTDLAVPRYDLPPHRGLITSGILYPLTRALFASRVRFPMTIDLGLSLRMAERLAAAAHRFTMLNQGEAPLWPINEATVAGFTINEFDIGRRTQPHPPGTDLNTILPLVAGSLFSDIEAKAAFWQRMRQLPHTVHSTSKEMLQVPSSDWGADTASMLETFRLANTNLQEIWRLVLPPSSLLALKRLAATDDRAFRMPESLWTRVVFDFLLAYRLRTINRGHLFGALIPLYLAWVAGHVNMIDSGVRPEDHIEAVAAAFEADKTYLVSRWRWPDRFNP